MHDIAPLGTSYDLRGIYGQDLDSESYYRLGYAIALLFPSDQKAAIGYDARVSSPELATALVRGLRSGGRDVVELGLASTDMVSFATVRYPDIDLGCMITASHNPPEYNGLKLCGKNATPLNLKLYGSQLRETMRTGVQFAPIIGTTETRDIVSDWVEHVASFVDRSVLTPKKIVVDASNGVAGVFMPQLAERLGLDMIPLYFEPDGTFPHHPPNPIEPKNCIDLRAKILETRADLGIIFDGDADRAYVLDEQGEPITGTIATAIIASILLARHPGATILSNTVTGNIVRETAERLGGQHRRTKVGHVYFKEIMRDDPSIIFGGEHSGHYYLRANANADSGIIASVILLQYICQSGQTVSDIRTSWDPYCHIPETNFRVASVPDMLSRLQAELAGGETDTSDGLTVQYADWWCNIRPSSNEPLLRVNVEAVSEELLQKGYERIRAVIER